MSVSRPTRPLPAPNVARLKTYKAPKAPAPTDLKLDSNESLPPPPEVLRTLGSIDPQLVCRYVKPTALEHRIAEMWGIAPAHVLVGAGADESIDRVCRSFLPPDREMLIATPTFEMFTVFAGLSNAPIRRVAWDEGPFPTEALIDKVDDKTGVIVMISPNNPTGLTATEDDLRRISAAAPHALILLDLAYSEFADVDLTPAALELPNVLAAHTFSKAWGLAGARLGYVVGPLELIDVLRGAGGPYPVSGLSLALAEKWIPAGRPHMEAVVRRVREERAELIRLCERIGIEALPSQANFVFVRLPDPELTRDLLSGLGISVRVVPDDNSFRGGLRISCPVNERDFERLCKVLETVCKPEALLFDMDGVLVDVSGSYRVAVQAACRHFGIDVSAEEVAAAKAEAGANNDWVVSRRLLERRGVDAAFEDVKAAFEAAYQGTDDDPGLWQRETLIPSRGMLERLSVDCPLGIVTGRPRADALRFLEAHDLSKLFKTVVCMEDAPAKPDPAPVKLALERLGVERAWMLGDAPDDVRAARAAGVLPLGKVAPGDDSDTLVRALHAAGAGRVIHDFDELERMWP